MTAIKEWVAQEEVAAADLNSNFEETYRPNVAELLAGEALIAGNSAYVSDGSEFDELSQSYNGSNNGISPSTDWYAAFFTTGSDNNSIKKLIIYGMNNSGTSFNVTASIRATSGGLPTGADLASVAATGTCNSQNEGTAFVFDFSGLALSASTTYAIVIKSSGTNDRFSQSATAGAKSTDSGSTWGAHATSFAYRVKLGVNRTVGRVYKTQADKYDIRGKLKGFVLDTVAMGDPVRIQHSGVMTLSGLTAGAEYYLSNTAGAISTSEGTVPRKIGRALNTTLLQIDIEKNRFIPFSTVYALASQTNGGDSTTFIRDPIIQAETTSSFSKATPAAIGLLVVLVSGTAANVSKIKKNGASTYLQPSSVFDHTFAVSCDLDSDNLYQVPAVGFSSCDPFSILGYYI